MTPQCGYKYDYRVVSGHSIAKIVKEDPKYYLEVEALYNSQSGEGKLIKIEIEVILDDGEYNNGRNTKKTFEINVDISPHCPLILKEKNPKEYKAYCEDDSEASTSFGITVGEKYATEILD